MDERDAGMDERDVGMDEHDIRPPDGPAGTPV
jgi:hypothetical protein